MFLQFSEVHVLLQDGWMDESVVISHSFQHYFSHMRIMEG